MQLLLIFRLSPVSWLNLSICLMCLCDHLKCSTFWRPREIRQLPEIRSCPHRSKPAHSKEVGSEAMMIRKTPAPPLKLESFQTSVHNKVCIFRQLRPHQAPLCLFKQVLIRLVDFISCPETQRGQVERWKQSETKGSAGRPSLFDLVGGEMCSLSSPYAPHHHLIIPHLPTHTNTHAFALTVQRSETPSTRTRACLSFCFSKRQRLRERHREELWGALPTFLSI